MATSADGQGYAARGMDLRRRLVERRFRAAIARDVRPGRFAAYGEGALVHPPLRVDHPERVEIGAATYILRDATLAVGPTGRLVIGPRTYLGKDLTIVALGSVTLGADVMGSDRLLIADSAPAPTRPGVPVRDQDHGEPRPVVVGDGVFLGTGAMVLAGVTVGARSLVAAGAVVTHSCPPNCVLAGNPARIVRRWDVGAQAWVTGAPDGP